MGRTKIVKLIVLAAAALAALVCIVVLFTPAAAVAPPALPTPTPTPAPAASTTTPPATPTPALGKSLAELTPSLPCAVNASSPELVAAGAGGKKQVPVVRCDSQLGVSIAVYGPFTDKSVQGVMLLAIPRNAREFPTIISEMASCITKIAGEPDSKAAHDWLTAAASSRTGPDTKPSLPPPGMGEAPWRATEGLRFQQNEKTFGNLRVRLRHSGEVGGPTRPMLQLIIGRDVSEME